MLTTLNTYIFLTRGEYNYFFLSFYTMSVREILENVRYEQDIVNDIWYIVAASIS